MKRSPLRRKSRLKPRNAKRRASEFARCYHSTERVAWVKSLGCAACAEFGLPAITLPWRNRLIENAHTVTGGKGRKADYSTVIPLCVEHHRRYDEHLPPFDDPAMRDLMKDRAGDVESAWREVCAEIQNPIAQ